MTFSDSPLKLHDILTEEGETKTHADFEVVAIAGEAVAIKELKAQSDDIIEPLLWFDFSQLIELGLVVKSSD